MIEIILTEPGIEVGAEVLESAYLAAEIEQSQLLPGYLDAGDFPFRKSSSAITACDVATHTRVKITMPSRTYVA